MCPQNSEFTFGRGYQIYITAPNEVTLKLRGVLPVSKKSYSLKAGYNLIYSPRTSETKIAEALSNLKLGVDYSKILYYDAPLGRFLEYSALKKEFDALKPGLAYFISCLKDTVWDVPYSAPTSTFVYDGDGGRVKKTVGASNTTVYIGSLCEINGSTMTKHVFAGSNRIASVIASPEGAKQSLYYHPDHLGSSNIVTSETGSQVGFTEFRPYGSTYKQSGSYKPKYKFTGKEQDSTGLYFYGARYYDPALGRFITADTIVQAPYDPQSLNRYSYCRNNPINLVDPTGNFWFIPLIIGIIKGAIAGALIGGAIAAITGQNLAQGFLTGAISGAIFGGVGGLSLKGIGHTIGHSLAGAASGAATGAITGGDIGMNALIGGLSAGVSERLGNFGPLRDGGIGGNIGNLLRRAFIGSVVGGSVAAATGGSFGYGAKMGAMTSAIAYTANEAMHPAVEAVEQAVDALISAVEVKPARDIKLDQTKSDKILGGVDPGKALRLAGKAYSKILGMKGAGLILDVAGESLSNRGFFEKLMSGAGSSFGFFLGSVAGAYSGVGIGAPVLGLTTSAVMADRVAIYGRVADEFWGTRPNQLFE